MTATAVSDVTLPSLQVTPADYDSALRHVTASHKWRHYSTCYNKLVHVVLHVLVISALWMTCYVLHVHRGLNAQLGTALFVVISVAAVLTVYVICGCFRRRVSHTVGASGDG